MKLLFLLMALVSCTSCTKVRLYTGPELSTERISEIALESGSDMGLTSVLINGTDLGMNPLPIEMLPGEVVIRLNWNYRTEEGVLLLPPAWTKSGTCRVAFMTQAGKHYSVVTEMSQEGTWFSDARAKIEVYDFENFFWTRPPPIATGQCSYNGRHPTL